MAKSKRLTPDQIKAITELLEQRDLLVPLRQLCKLHHVTLGDVLRGSATTQIVRARDACIVHLLSLGFSLSEVGRLVRMHHTSVMAARVRSEKRHMPPVEPGEQ
jgi:transposase-like protein